MSEMAGSWVQAVATALRGAHGIELDELVDRDTTLQAWHAADLAPERVVKSISSLELALARWLARFAAPTRVTYQRGLRQLARTLQLDGSSSVVALLAAAARKPRTVERHLAAFAAAPTPSTATRRQWLSAIRSASVALLTAGIALRGLRVALPTDVDGESAAVRGAELDAIDRTLADIDDPLAQRTRVSMLLAYAGLRAHELVELETTAIDIERRRVRVAEDFVPLDVRTVQAIEVWLGTRGFGPGPLLATIVGKPQRDNVGKPQRIVIQRITERTLQRGLIKYAGGATANALRNGGILDADERGRLHAIEVARLARHRPVGVERVARRAAPLRREPPRHGNDRERP